MPNLNHIFLGIFYRKYVPSVITTHPSLSHLLIMASLIFSNGCRISPDLNEEISRFDRKMGVTPHEHRSLARKCRVATTGRTEVDFMV